MLLDSDVVRLSSVQDEHLSPQAGCLLRRIRGLVERHGQVDTGSLMRHLIESAALERCGGPIQVLSLANTPPTASMWRVYERQILEAHRRRELARIATELFDRTQSDEMPPARAASRAAQALVRSCDGEEVVDGRALALLADRHIKGDLEKASKPVPWFCGDLVRGAGGLPAGDVTIVAGRPGSGKTTLACNQAVESARAGHFVHVISLEMAPWQLALKLCEVLSGEALFDREGRGAVSSATGRALIELAGLPVSMQAASRRVGEFLARAESEVRRGSLQTGRTPLVVLDYIQRARPDQPTGNPVIDVGETSAAVLDFAKRTRAAVLMLAQVNRACEKRASQQPLASDLKHCGDLEQDAAQIITLYRACIHDDAADASRLEAAVRKQRFGKAGQVVALRFDGATSTISNWRRE